MNKIDLHIHSTASDGTDSPECLYQKLLAAGIHTFALTDHDTVDGIPAMRELCRGDQAPAFIPGIEFSCRSPLRKCHILGLGIDETHPAITGLIKEGQQLRRKKYLHRLDWLREKFGIIYPEESLQRFAQIDNIGKPHLAEELVRMGLAQTVNDAILKYLYKCDQGYDYKLDAGEAIRVILASGGIPVWAHPLGGENSVHISKELVEAHLQVLVPYGLQGMECYYSRYTKKEAAELLSCADQFGLLVSGGSDYHGTTKTISLGELSAEGQAVCLQDLTITKELRI